MSAPRLMVKQAAQMTLTITRLAWIVMFGALLAPATARAQDEVIYYHTDAIGSVRMITDANGAVIDRYDFLPFGERWTGPPPIPTQDLRQFAGKERDAQTHLDYFGARDYRDVMGRFTTVDPVLDQEKATGDPQHFNRYAYARNNPLRYIDPDGRDAVLAGSLMRAKPYAWAAEVRSSVSDWISGSDGSISRSVTAGITDAFIGTFLPTNDSEAFWNSLPMLGTAASRGAQMHHIATNKSIVSGWTAAFEEMFASAGKTLIDKSNLVSLVGHSGRHAKAYHQYVLDSLQSAVDGLEGEQYNRALAEVLERLRKTLLANPDMIRGKLPK